MAVRIVPAAPLKIYNRRFRTVGRLSPYRLVLSLSSVDVLFVVPVRFCNPFLPIFNHVYLRNY